MENVDPRANQPWFVADQDCNTATLVDLLKQVEQCPEIVSDHTDENGRRFISSGDGAHILLQKIVFVADSALIHEGRCNYHAHQYLKAFGFNVTPGEKDSFGWLTGCIHTKKGIVVYG